MAEKKKFKHARVAKHAANAYSPLIFDDDEESVLLEAAGSDDAAGKEDLAEDNLAEVNPTEEDLTEKDLADEDLTYEQRAIDRRLSEMDDIQETISRERREWFMRNRMIIMILAGILAVGLIFLGIKVYNDSHNPMSRFIKASANNLSTSFSFNLTAEKNGASMLHYTGTAQLDPDRQRVSITYDADCVDYQYRNVIYTDDQTTFKGNYYNGQWTLSDSTERVQNYFDFYKDYRTGKFDGGAFLRFFALTSKYSATDTEQFINLLMDRLSTDSNIAKYTTVNDDKGTTYRYEVDPEALCDLIINQGASTFFRSTDYNDFVKKVDANRARIAASECAFSFTVSPSGYLSILEFEIMTPDGSYTVKCLMGNFGNKKPDISDDFYEAAGIENPNQP